MLIADMLLEALLQLYAHASPQEFPQKVMQSARLLFSDGLVSLDEVFQLSGEMIHHIDDRDAPRYYPQILEGWSLFSHQHPGIQYAADGGKEPILYLKDMISHREFRRLDVYQTVFGPMELRDEITFMLPSSSSSTMGVTVCLPHDVTHAQRKIAATFYPHLLQARQNSLRTINPPSCPNNQKIYKIEIPVAQGAPIKDWPLEARLLLDGFFFGRTQLPWQPPPELLSWLQRRREALTQEASDWRRMGPLMIKNRRGSLHVNFSRGLDSENEVLFLTGTIQESSAPSMEKKLTLREAQVMSWVAEGKTNLEIALILSISVSTVKKHLEHIFEKLCVENRSALISLALKSPLQK